MTDREAAMPHTYRLTIQEVDDAADRTPVSLSFYVSNHDDLMQVFDRVRERKAVPEVEAAEFALGLKLFSEVLLRHRREPLFAELLPHVGAFMRKLKGHDATRA
jgi:hypothetical protein